MIQLLITLLLLALSPLVFVLAPLPLGTSLSIIAVLLPIATILYNSTSRYLSTKHSVWLRWVQYVIILLCLMLTLS